MTIRRLAFLIQVVLVCVVSDVPLRAQTQGRITGVVRDSTGAAVPGVTMTATNQSTKLTQTTVTAGNGSYSFSLPAGTYSLTATLQGFRRVTKEVEVTGGAPKSV